MLIEVISGHETFSGGFDTRVGVFYRNQADETALPIHDVARHPNGGVSQIGTPTFMLACEANRNHGSWTIARYAVRDDSFTTVLISKKLPGDFIRHNKQLMLYCRAGAALRRITLPFSGHEHASLSSGHIEGRFDILTLRMIAEMGIKVTDNVLPQFDFSDEIDPADFYTERTIEVEKSNLVLDQKEAVVTEKGNTVRIARPRRRVIVPK